MSKLKRDPKDKVIGGVCSGLAKFLGVDTVIVRLAFLVAFFGFGVGVIPYIIMWAIVPEETEENN